MMMCGQNIADLVLYYFMSEFRVPYTPRSVNFYCICNAFMQAYGSILLNIFENRELYFADFGEDHDLHYRNIFTLHISLKKIFTSMPRLHRFNVHEQPRILIRTCSVMAMSVIFFVIAGVPYATDKGFLYIASAADQCISRSTSLRHQPLVTFSSDYYDRNPPPHCSPPAAPFYPPFHTRFTTQWGMPPVIEPSPDVVLRLPPIPDGVGTITVATSSGSSRGRCGGRKVGKKTVLFYHKSL